MLSWGKKRYLIALLAGLFANLALPPFDFFAALFVSFPVLVWLIDGASGRPDKGVIARGIPSFITGWFFGFGYFVGGLWWLANAVLQSEEQVYWAIPFALFGLPALLAIFYGFAAAFARLFWREGLGRIFALSASFGLFEFLRGYLFTGFPWNTIGYSAMPVPLAMQSSQVIGIYGMSILAVFVASVPALLTAKKGFKPGLILAILFVSGHLGFGFYTLNFDNYDPGANPTNEIVRIVQPSIDQNEKWDDEKRAEIFSTYLELSSQAPLENSERPSLIVWPETAIPYILTKTPPALSQIADMLKIGQTLLTGAVRLEEGAGDQADAYYNTIYAINDDGQIVGSADKVHLVPFGEYLPFESLARSIGLAPLAEAFGGFSSARRQKILTLSSGLKLLPLICYEAIFPQYSDNRELNADALINVTNDAWYGATPGPYQHLRQAQLRAVESGLPLIRAGNNGISVVTDPYGQVIYGMKLDHVGFIDVEIPPKRVISWDYSSRNIGFVGLLSIFLIFSALFRTKNTG